jgi:hypothetical protein
LMSLSFRFHWVVCFSTASIGGCPSDTKKSYLATGPNFGDKLTIQIGGNGSFYVREY